MKLTETITVDNLDVKVAPDLHTRLRWKEYQILSLLVKNSPKAVTRGEFVNQIWKGTYCSDSTINQTIKSIRKKNRRQRTRNYKNCPACWLYYRRETSI
ncbi:helix-turn-helix domain-containing protein [Candidatus Sodalis sp. SoCistrobi]|uniref:winged helix-turn-helix domain-containing protein n=1 Tax=Candidatus Sodalis sp. SoCistrobi TaxID=1922216 RepID=UPI00093EFED7|nr:helix-turn-helix domain-containing protein [Candidatus Sodalis sp. SoCistrobi]